jgi:integrase
MAHIDRRDRNGTVRYVARYIDPAGQERSKSFTRRADAQKYLTEIEAAKLRGTWVDPTHGRTLFGDWHGEWWATTVNLRPKTRTRNEMVFRLYVLPRFGAVPLDAITQREVRAWVTSLTVKGLAPATVHKAYQLFAKTMAAAVDGGMLAQTPCRGVALPKVEHEEMRYLNPAEIACLAEAIRPGYQALVFVGAYGGLRIGELAGLRRSRVDLEAGTVDVAETVVEVEGRAAVRAAQDPGRPAPDRAASPGGRRAGAAPASAGSPDRSGVPLPGRRAAAGDRVPQPHLAAGHPGGGPAGAAHP